MRAINSFLLLTIITSYFVFNTATANETTAKKVCEVSDEIKKSAIKSHLYSVNVNLCKNISLNLLLTGKKAPNTDELTKQVETVMKMNTVEILSLFDKNNQEYQNLSKDIESFMKGFSALVTTSIKQDGEAAKLNSVAVISDNNYQEKWMVSGHAQLNVNLSKYKQSGICKVIQVKGKQVKYDNCKALFDDISKGVGTYRDAYDAKYAESNQQLLSALNKDWKTFVEEARNQTWLDENVDFIFNRTHYSQDHLTGPAKVQYFFLHPSLVYEWISDEPGGQEDKVSAALEIIGFNRWDDRVPWGLSLMTVISSRANYETVSPGLSLYIDNKYSLGMAYRFAKDGKVNDDEWSIFVNIDLLNFGEQRKNQFDKYVDKVKNF